MTANTNDPLTRAAEEMGSNLRTSERIEGDRVTVHAYWDTESYETTSRGPTTVLVELDHSASTELAARGINASVMARASRAVVAMAEDMHQEVERDTLAHARQLAAAVPMPRPDRGKYLDALLAVHSELVRLGRAEVINDLRDLVLMTQQRAIPKGTLRVHVWQAKERAAQRRQRADEGQSDEG